MNTIAFPRTPATRSTEEAVPDKPFRLLDLPPELRDEIYSYLLVTRWNEDGDELLLVAFHKTYGSRPYLLQHPPLLEVCRQIREEADSIYWGRNRWKIRLDALQKNANPDLPAFIDSDLQMQMGLLARWVQKMGGNSRFRYLKDLTVDLDVGVTQKRPVELRMTVNGAGGTTLYTPSAESCKLPRPIQPDAIGWHFANTIQRGFENDWRGETIVDFFLADTTLWESWFCSLPDKEEVDMDYLQSVELARARARDESSG